MVDISLRRRMAENRLQPFQVVIAGSGNNYAFVVFRRWTDCGVHLPICGKAVLYRVNRHCRRRFVFVFLNLALSTNGIAIVPCPYSLQRCHLFPSANLDHSSAHRQGRCCSLFT